MDERCLSGDPVTGGLHAFGLRGVSGRMTRCGPRRGGFIVQPEVRNAPVYVERAGREGRNFIGREDKAGIVGERRNCQRACLPERMQ